MLSRSCTAVITWLACANVVFAEGQSRSPESEPQDLVVERAIYPRSGPTSSPTHSKLAGRIQLIKGAASLQNKSKGTSNFYAYDSCAALMQNDPSITSCSPDYKRYIAQENDDPLSSSQWMLESPIEVGASINLPEYSFALPYDSVIAVIDTGADLTHPDLAPNLWNNPHEISGNGVDDDENGYIDDIHGADVIHGTGDPSFVNEPHGTMVSGIIGARWGNGIGIRGLGNNLPVIIVKADNARGVFSVYGFSRALDYLTDLKARLGIPIVAVNVSLGGPSASLVELRALERARDAGIMIVAAAGNEASNIDTLPVYPASYAIENVLSVAAVERSGERAFFSNYGILGVDVAAPGVDLLSTIPGASYGLFSGTSAATPVVTSLVGVLRARFSELSLREVKRALLASGRTQPSLRSYTLSGTTVDFKKSLDTAAKLGGSIDANNLKSLELYDGVFSVQAFDSSIFSSPKKHPLKTLSLTVKREDFSSNQGLATLILQFGVGNYLCDRLVKVSEIDTPSIELVTSLRLPRKFPHLSVYAINGESEVTGSSRVKLRGVKRFPTNAKSSKSILRRHRAKACNDLVVGLSFAK